MRNLLVAVTLLLFVLQPSMLAANCANDISANFTLQPPRTQLVDFQQSGDNLVLRCEVTGIPTPSVSWFREGTSTPVMVNSNTLSIRINESEAENKASREGTNYYCEATNRIGRGNFKAVLRSRNVSVSHSFFGGFRNTVVRDVSVPTVEGGAVALECDFEKSIPAPDVTWFADNVLIEEMRDCDLTQILLLEEGRYLFIQQLTATMRMRRYHCGVNNFHDESGRPIRAPTTYTLTANLPHVGLHEYKGLGTKFARVGEQVEFVYAAAARDATGDDVEFAISCYFPHFVFVIITLHNITVTVQETARNQDLLTFSCQTLVFDSNLQLELFEKKVTGAIIILRPPNITNPAPDAECLTDRRRLVGGGPVEYHCDVSGSPTPTITWYYNGAVIQSDSGGVVVDGNATLTISAPLVSHSGIYQCFAVNSVGEDSRAWTLEVLDPDVRIVSTHWMEDSQGTSGVVSIDNHIIAFPETPTFASLIVTVLVNSTSVRGVDTSGSCPSVQWSVNGTNITNSADYTISDPCVDTTATSPYNFTLTIATLTQNTSGDYSAVFSHLTATDSHQPPIFITIAGPSIVIDMTGPGEVDVGSVLVLECSIRAILPTIVMWQKDGHNLTNITTELTISPIMDGVSTLTKELVTQEDGGTYRCVTISGAGIEFGREIEVEVTPNMLPEMESNIGAIVGGVVVGGLVAVILSVVVIIIVLIKKGGKKEEVIETVKYEPNKPHKTTDVTEMEAVYI